MDPDRVDVSPIENGDISASYLSLPDVNHWMIGWAAAKSLAVPWRCWSTCWKKRWMSGRMSWSPEKRTNVPLKRDSIPKKDRQILQLWKERTTLLRVVWNTLPKTNSSPLKMDGWKTSLSYWNSSFFRGHVRFRRCNSMRTLFCSISNVRSEFGQERKLQKQ